MKNKLLQEIIEHLLEVGIEITIKRENSITIYDLNTEMKSHIHLVVRGDVVIALCRYGMEFEIESVEDIVDVAWQAMCGRDFMSEAWEAYLAPHIKNWEEE